MRFGMSWRPEIGSGILRHLDAIDVVEILAEEFLEAGASQRRALRFLGSRVTVVVHATSLGMASTEPVSRKRLEAVARLIGEIEPLFWSEHLAFVRAGGAEIGHLAAPPRNDETLEGLNRNIELSRNVVGSAPLLENIATLLDPPFSSYDEAEWLTAVTRETRSNLLLDLHNLHANAVNFGFDAGNVIRRIPHDRIGAIHLAGGRRIEGGRILDDHLHAVPDAVYSLLGHIKGDAAVILERDGEYPEFALLLDELRRARDAAGCADVPQPPVEVSPERKSQAPAGTLQFLARLYTDSSARSRFLARPYEEAQLAGFSPGDAQRLAAMNGEDLALAASSFARKRTLKAKSAERES